MALDRYRQPTAEELSEMYGSGPEPSTGACWNCAHSVEVKIKGISYLLCVRERDEGGEGDVYVSDERECPSWEDGER